MQSQSPCPFAAFAEAPLDVISSILRSMELKYRFQCALVCKSWAKAATAATQSIIKHNARDLSSLQKWLQKHGSQIEQLQLQRCTKAPLTELPCAELKDLVLHGTYTDALSVDGSIWSSIAAATKLTALNLWCVDTQSQPSDVVAAILALPSLQQLIWRDVRCKGVLQHLTHLSHLDLRGGLGRKGFFSSEQLAVLHNLSTLTKLQQLTVDVATPGWPAADFDVLQGLKRLTSLHIVYEGTVPHSSITQLTALQRLIVSSATASDIEGLWVFTGLTDLRVNVASLTPGSTFPCLPSLQVLQLGSGANQAFWPTSYLAGCTAVRQLAISGFDLAGVDSLVGSSMLQHLKIVGCDIGGDAGLADVTPWQSVLHGLGCQPHLTWLHLSMLHPELQDADMESIAARCSSLQKFLLHRGEIGSKGLSALAPLPHLTSLHLFQLTSMLTYLPGVEPNKFCSALELLTGLQELRLSGPDMLAPTNFRQLAALQQLTVLGLVNTFFERRGRPDLVRQHLLDDIPLGPCRGLRELDAVCEEEQSDYENIIFSVTARKPGIRNIVGLVNKAPYGAPPDVAARLLRACDSYMAWEAQQCGEGATFVDEWIP